MSTGLPWSAIEVRLLTALVAAGLTSRAISERLGSRTRNAVIGECHRRGLQLQHKPVHFPKAIVMPPFGVLGKGKKVPPHARVPPDEPAPRPPRPGPVIHTEAADWQCRWPVSKPTAAMLVCGERKANGYSYCMQHCRIAFHGWRNLTPPVVTGGNRNAR